LAYLRGTGERLRQANLRNLLDFVAEVEAAALVDEPALRSLVVATLPRLIAGDGAMLTGFDARAHRTVTTATDPRLAALRAREPGLWASCLQHHPTVVAFNAAPAAPPLRFSDAVASRAYRRLPIYAYFFRPFGVEHKVDVRVWPGEHHLDVGCWRERRDFDEQDRAVLGALRPYLAVVFRRASGAVVAARLREAFGLTAREADVLALVVRGRSAPEVARELVIAVGTARKHIEHIHRKLGVSNRAQAIARVVQQTATASTAETEPMQELLGRLEVDDAVAVYGLTDRETEVLLLAAGGDTNAQIASKLGVRPETVKKHLDHVYAKVGVAGRGRVAARLRALSGVEPPRGV
jgi:DNA-binding CsgD family transcriptional regulator